VTIKVDLSNAFNNVSRAHFIDIVAELLPEMYEWVRWCYESQSDLTYGDYVIPSKEGVQQGDPLGPLLFALVIQKVINRIQADLAKGVNVNLWYLDDGTLGGHPDTVFRAMKILVQDGPALGLFLNASKCEILSHPGAANAAKRLQTMLEAELGTKVPNDKLFLDGNYCMLGAPIGSPAFCASYVREHSLKPATESLTMAKKIHDPQVAHALLRRCAGFGQLVHAIRATPPSDNMQELCTEFDKDMLEAVLSFIGPVDPKAYPQIRRSTKTGGLGFRACVTHMQAAYVGSVVTCSTLDSWAPQRAEGYVDATLHLALVSNLSQEEIEAYGSQKQLSEVLCNALFTQEQQRDSQEDLARKISQAGEGASKWLTAIPSRDFGQSFTPREYVTLVRWWLGQDVYHEEALCKACGENNDRKGYHALTCQCWGGRIHRHHAISNECAKILTKAHHNPTRERSLDGRTRPADVYIPHWSAGRPLALDFAVTHPLQSQSFNMAEARTPGSWAGAYAEKHKSKYIEPCNERGVDFQAMVVETYGAWDPAALIILNEIANQYAKHQQLDPAAAAERLFTKLSVTLMRLNARMMLVRSNVKDTETKNIPADHALDRYPFMDEGLDANQEWAMDEDEIRF
jgi:hypothetical protein